MGWLQLRNGGNQGQTQWRASLESPHTGEHQSFASLEQCFAYLREQFESKEINHVGHEGREEK